MEVYGVGRMAGMVSRASGRSVALSACFAGLCRASPVPVSAREIGHRGKYHAMNRIFLAVASPGPC